MSTPSSYTSLDIFSTSKKLVLACYALAQDLPPEEKTNLSFYLRNAALKAHIAIAQGAFLKKVKARQKYLQQAKTSFIIIETVIDILVETGFANQAQTTAVMELSSACYQQVENFVKES